MPDGPDRLARLVGEALVLPSQITTHGWFHRSRIHSTYSGMIFSAVRKFRGAILSDCGFRSQIGNSSWIRKPSSSAMSYQKSGGKPMQ